MGTRKHPSRGITQRLRVVAHIAVGVHPLRVALSDIGRHKAAHHRIIVPRVVVVQPAGIEVLAREALVGRNGPLAVALCAVGTVGLVAGHGGAAGDRRDAGEHRAQFVGEQEDRDARFPLADETTGKQVGVVLQ